MAVKSVVGIVPPMMNDDFKYPSFAIADRTVDNPQMFGGVYLELDEEGVKDLQSIGESVYSSRHAMLLEAAKCAIDKDFVKKTSSMSLCKTCHLYSADVHSIESRNSAYDSLVASDNVAFMVEASLKCKSACIEAIAHDGARYIGDELQRTMNTHKRELIPFHLIVDQIYEDLSNVDDNFMEFKPQRYTNGNEAPIPQPQRMADNHKGKSPYLPYIQTFILGVSITVLGEKIKRFSKIIEIKEFKPKTKIDFIW